MVEGIREGDIPGVQLRCRERLPVAAADAWRWLVEPEKLEQWLADEAQADPEHLRLGRSLPETGEVVERGETLDLHPGRRWVLSFHQENAGWEASTQLTWEVTDAIQGCEISVLHQGFQRLALSQCLTIWEGYRRRWRAALQRLKEAVAEEGSGRSQ